MNENSNELSGAYQMYCLKLMLHCNLRTSIRFIHISLRVARGAAMKTRAVVPFLVNYLRYSDSVKLM
jgi:hypothetical protein